MKTIAIIGTLLVSAGLTLAQTNNANTNLFSVNEDIPVGNPVGLVSYENMTGLAGDTISDITVSLDIAGGFNGSLYAYLVGPNGGFDVLLNQPGSADGSIGYLDAGLDNVTLDDSAGVANNIQTYQLVDNPNGAALTGTWQSAGDDLSSFAGTSPDGTWTLFVANLTGGSPQSALVSWSLIINTEPVPEPQAWTMCAAGALMLFAGFKWRGKAS